MLGLELFILEVGDFRLAHPEHSGYRHLVDRRLISVVATPIAAHHEGARWDGDHLRHLLRLQRGR